LPQEQGLENTMKNAGEKAMALVDGQLAPAEVPELVQELARSPALVAELQTYLAISGRRIAEPFAAKGTEPVPAWLVDALVRAPASDSPSVLPVARSAGVLALLKRRCAMPVWSLAAGPALAAGLVAFAVWMAMPAALRRGPAEASLGIALERTESGKDAALVALRPVLSFKSKTAGWCRQYELRYATRQASQGLACRGNEGQWVVVASTAPGRIGPRPAGAEPRRAIDDLVTAMMGDQPLSNADETAKISKGWLHP
jgi:hypothetical protein